MRWWGIGPARLDSFEGVRQAVFLGCPIASARFPFRSLGHTLASLASRISPPARPLIKRGGAGPMRLHPPGRPSIRPGRCGPMRLGLVRIPQLPPLETAIVSLLHLHQPQVAVGHQGGLSPVKAAVPKGRPGSQGGLRFGRLELGDDAKDFPPVTLSSIASARCLAGAFIDVYRPKVRVPGTPARRKPQPMLPCAGMVSFASAD